MTPAAGCNPGPPPEPRNVDAQIGEGFAALDAHGLRDETLVILAAGHGEMFLEHGEIGHCRELYDDVVHTPLVLWGPGGSGRRVRAPVANLDVVPTILDYLRIPIPPGLAGRSLRPLVEGADALPPQVAVCASMLTQVAASDGRFKLVRDVANGAERLKTARPIRERRRTAGPSSPGIAIGSRRRSMRGSPPSTRARPSARSRMRTVSSSAYATSGISSRLGPWRFPPSTSPSPPASRR